MFRPFRFALAVAATFYGLIGQAAPTVPFAPPPFQVAVGTGGTLTGDGSPAVRIDRDRLTHGSTVMVRDSAALARTAPIDGERADTPIATLREHASGSHGLLSSDGTSEGASKPSVFAMILAGFGMMGFIAMRYVRTP